MGRSSISQPDTHTLTNTMKVLIITLALISCAVAKPKTAGHPISEEQQFIPSASLIKAFEAELKPHLSPELSSAPRKWVCYWFGCIWIPGRPNKPTAAPTTTTTTTEAPFMCTSEGLFPDRDDCSKFIICQDAVEGHFIEHTLPCPANLFYNPEIKQCDYPENVASCQD